MYLYSSVERAASSLSAHPVILGEQVAQKIYDTPVSNEWTYGEIRSFGQYATSYYRDKGRLDVRFEVSEHVWRAGAAPLLHGIHAERASVAEQFIAEGRPLVTAWNPEHDGRMERILKIPGHESFRSKRFRSFLMASAGLSILATENVLKARLRPGHWAGPIYDVAAGLVSDYTYNSVKPRGLPILGSCHIDESSAWRYIFDLAVTPNLTSISLLDAAREHYLFWAAGDVRQTLGLKVGQLAWSASLAGAVFQQYFSADRGERKSCPFTHEADSNPDDIIWSVPALKNGPQIISRRCPAAVPLHSRHYHGYENRRTSAAEILLRTNIAVAAETLWKDE